MKGRLISATLAAALLVPTVLSAQASERYRLDGGPDVASGLALHPDGRFEYFLVAGALDEQAQGTWKREGNLIRLTTMPRPRPAQFSALDVQRASAAPLTVQVVWPDGRGVPLVDVVMEFATGDPVEGYTQEDGLSLDAAETRVARSVRFAVPMYGLRSPEFPIDSTKGNIFRFVLTPNDLGVADFDGLPLFLRNGGLVMRRGGADIVYVKER